MAESVERALYPFERLSDLTNAQANKILKNCYAHLEQCQSDEDLLKIPQVMEINDELFHDLLELMKLKGWLAMEQ